MKHRLYYRRRILLAILAHAGGRVEKIRLQKLLFLFTRQQEKPAYHFLPYKFGCYSFQAANDARILAARYDMLADDKNHYSLNRKNVDEKDIELNDADSKRLADLFRRYGNLNRNSLIYQVYEQYPRYAINSELLDKPRFRPLSDRIKKEKIRKNDNRPTLYTIGYEGASVEEYITRLMENAVSVLVDVRHNPFSMKYGFSRAPMQHITGECGIRYIHIPELGIVGSRRKHLKSRADFDRLFALYRQSLPEQEESLQCIQDMLHKYTRIALTCFEKDHAWCHRHAIAEAIRARCEITVEHL